MRVTVGRFGDISKSLLNLTFGDRCIQFVDRLRWDLGVHCGMFEFDQYDNGLATYVVVEDRGDHMVSCRFRRLESPTMVSELFRHLFSDAINFLEGQTGTIFELTRLCRNPELTVLESIRVLNLLGSTLNKFKHDENAIGFVAVVYAPITRLLIRRKACFLKLASARMYGKPVDLIFITGFGQTFPPSELLLASESVEAGVMPTFKRDLTVAW